MKLREHHLIQCKFTRVDVSAKESGFNAYYYYVYHLSKNNLNKIGFCLVSSTSDNIKDENWVVSFLEVDDYEITTFEDLIKIIQTFNYIKKQ